MKSKEIIKYFIGILLLVCLSISTMSTVFAASDVTITKEWKLTGKKTVGSYNVTDKNIYKQSLERGTNRPTSFVDLNSEALTFSGEASNVRLYTNKGFTGKSRVSVSVSNWRSEPLTVIVYKDEAIDVRIKTLTIPANGGQASTVVVNAANDYYLAFEAPSNFSGSVS